MTSTTSTDSRYQGWTNYPTWAVNLWLAHDEPLCREALDMAEQAVADAPTDPNTIGEIWSAEDTAKFRLADAYKDWVREQVELDEASLASDLLGHALDSVDWEEIAASWIQDAAE